MNGLEASLDQARTLMAAVDAQPPAARVALCPPATLIWRMAGLLGGSSILVGGQDCRSEAHGPFTGDISAEMLFDAGARLVILGHSERRRGHGESDATVAAKVSAALRAGLEPIVCVGESAEERRSACALEVVVAQLRGSLPSDLRENTFAVAYEPVWAIGSGITPTLEQIEEIHRAVRETLEALFGDDGQQAPILYGGSVTGANAGPILHASQVGGALVGGASLRATDFTAILDAL